MTGYEVQLFAGVTLPHPITNGPGWGCKTVEEIGVLINAGVAMPVVGSITKEPREGNPGQTFWNKPGSYSFNALGLPNRGMPYYREALPQMVEMAHEAGLPICASVSEFTEKGFLELTEFFVRVGVDLSEQNWACPNVVGKRGLLCFDLKAMENMAIQVKAITSRFSVKLSIYSDPAQREDVAKLMKELEIPVVTLCNTFPDGLLLDEHFRPVLSPETKGGRGGMGGPAVKPPVEAHVATFREILHPWQKIIAIGGAGTGYDVFTYQELGADVVEMTTAHAERGPRVFGQVLQEWVELKER